LSEILLHTLQRKLISIYLIAAFWSMQELDYYDLSIMSKFQIMIGMTARTIGCK